jgi:hypothetical protein
LGTGQFLRVPVLILGPPESFPQAPALYLALLALSSSMRVLLVLSLAVRESLGVCPFLSMLELAAAFRCPRPVQPGLFVLVFLLETVLLFVHPE